MPLKNPIEILDPCQCNICKGKMFDIITESYIKLVDGFKSWQVRVKCLSEKENVDLWLLFWNKLKTKHVYHDTECGYSQAVN